MFYVIILNYENLTLIYKIKTILINFEYSIINCLVFSKYGINIKS